MLTKKQKEDLKLFFETLNQVARPKTPESLEQIFDLGLIILEEGTKAKTDEVEKILPKEKIGIIEYNDNKYETTFTERAADLIEKGKWVLINLQKEPGHELINQLRRLSDDNVIQLLNFKGKEVYNIKLPLQSRVVVIVKRNLLEKEISYPFFLNIFGPIISL